ncbi:unnamed protein product [Arctia plantaginis]|uniref:Major facilitator superfamily (MFS) profile domain-containing protein n=1 Tax=Arctia plantaginis TaxID=874455 RepID=A0A8S1AC52_ARCPL|nr:unnamed protein product [Arctia plantaginis]
MNIGRFRQVHTAFACGFGSFVMGMANTWPSYTSELLLSNSTPLSAPMTKAEEALLGSLPSLGAIFGSSIIGIMMARLGRRNGGVVSYLPALLAWAITSIASSIKLVLAARFLAGITGGAALVLGPVFISEVADDSVRGFLASAPIFLYCFGTFFSYLIGWYMVYRTIIWTNLIVCVSVTILLGLVTESPIYLLRQKREEDAKLSIAKYRGLPVSSMLVTDELTKLKQQITSSVEMVPITDPDTKTDESENEKLNLEEAIPQKPESKSTIKLLFLEPASRRAFTIVALVISIQVFMGIVPVQVFAKMVFLQTDPSMADLYTIVFAIVMLAGSAVTAVVSDKAGRRLLIISSSVLVSATMGVLGYLVQFKAGPPFLTVMVIFIYCFSFMLGAGSIPYVLLAEVFIPEVQNLASIIIIEFVWLLNFVIIYIFPYMNDMFGIYGTFYFFGIMGLSNSILSYFLVPETKGLSNIQIQDLLILRRKKYLK